MKEKKVYTGILVIPIYPPLLNNLTIGLNAEVPPLEDFTGCLAHYNKDNPL